MTQKLPFKEPGRAHKRRNNTGRLTFHFVLFALLGVMLLSLGAYGRVKLHGIYDQQLLSRRSDSLITDSTNLVKTTAEALAGTNNSLRTKISSRQPLVPQRTQWRTTESSSSKINLR